MLPRRALSAVQAARTRTLFRALGLPARFAAPSFRALSTSGRLFDAEASLLSQKLPSARDLPASILSKTRQQDDDVAAAVEEAGEASSSTESTTDKFENLKGKINHDIYKALTSRPFNFEKMSSVQEAVLNYLPGLAEVAVGENAATERKDLLVKAKTGTGKTIAFLVPAIENRFNELEAERKRFKDANPDVDKNTVSRHMAQYRKDTVGTVILSPTRELATQIATEAAKLLSHTDMDVRLFIGGASKGMQLRDFRFRRRDIIVATPGRMNDMLDEPMIQQAVHKAKVLVLDEADTLLDMGFKDAIDTIVRQMPPKGERQTFLFSATVSKEIQRIARSTLRPDHKFIDCVPANETNTHLHIPQYTSIIPSGQDQFLHIARLLAEDAMLHPDGGKAIIFLPTTKMTEITSLIVNAMRPHLPFGSRGTRVFEMHSKKSQHARDTTSSLFRQAKGGYSILVTSDVSARGVDYPGVTRVIQIGVPGSKDTYVHRVGRTGRAGKAGRGDLVLMPFEQAYVHHELQEIPFKPVDVGGLQASLEKMAAEHDANPTPGSSGPAPVLDRRVRPGMRGPPQQPARLQYPILPRLQGLEQRFRDEITPGISELDAKEAFGSQLGFYVGRTSEMGLSRGAVYEALQVWAVEAFGLAEPPTVGSRLMAALGLNKSGGGGMRGRNSGMRRSFNDSQGFRSNAPRMAAFRRGGSSDRRGGGGFRSNDRSDGERHGSYNGRNPYAPRGTTPW